MKDKKYRVIYIDPPWTFKSWSSKGDGKNANQHYDCMSIEDIENLPVYDLADKDCVLWCWMTDPLLPKQLNVVQKWGFKYVTMGFVWIKLNKKSPTPFVGTGYYTRANPEYCIIATKGKPGLPLVRNISKVVMSPIREHSRKPDIIRENIAKMYEGPRLEMFARQQTEGWDVWGNETTKFGGLY